MGLIISVLNPAKQLNKTRDAQRHHDLEQLRNALDTYYNDHNTYPKVFPPGGLEWKEQETIYMKKVPNDPTDGTDYIYEVDINSNNPQWAVLYANQYELSPSDCMLTSNCRPVNIGGYACLTLGSVDCDYIVSDNLPFILPTATPTSTATPTPTPSPTPPCSKDYKCTGQDEFYPKGRCNSVVSGLGDYCGYPGCSGNECCENQCSQ
ncbi:MAG: hypothetical protein Q8P80_04600 [Candidatus Levybacteria bacterium]|nr:hypothetical protein [Candidatus Levybacteria bacterium]